MAHQNTPISRRSAFRVVAGAGAVVAAPQAQARPSAMERLGARLAHAMQHEGLIGFHIRPGPDFSKNSDQAAEMILEFMDAPRRAVTFKTRNSGVRA